MTCYKHRAVSSLSSLLIVPLVLQRIRIDMNTDEMPRVCPSITSKNKLCQQCAMLSDWVM